MTDEQPFRVLLIIIATVQAVISFGYIKRASAGSTIFQHREEGTLLALSIVVCYLAFASAAFAYCVNPAWMEWSSMSISPWARWFGAILLAVGAPLMIGSLHHLGKNLTISIETRQGHAHIRSGPYRWVRHPLYVSGIVESVGVCLIMANWFATLSAALFWALIAYRTPLEEKKMIEVFGDEYRDYMRSVPRFLPRFPR